MDQYGEPDSKRKQVDDDIMCKLNDLGRKVQVRVWLQSVNFFWVCRL